MITAQTLQDHNDARDAILQRLNEIARYCHAQRKIVRDNAVPPLTRRWVDPEKGLPEDFEVYDGQVHVKYQWWNYDSQDDLTISFPISYLDEHDSIWQAREASAADVAVARKREHDATLAEHAETTRKAAFELKQAQTRQRMIETVPGFEQMPELTQQSIIATAMGARP